MNELLKIDTSNAERITVSARDLYEFLEATERFNSWFDRMKQYGLTEGEDFTSVKSFTVVNNGAHKEIDDYQLTIDTAKLQCYNATKKALRLESTSFKLRMHGIALKKLWQGR